MTTRWCWVTALLMIVSTQAFADVSEAIFIPQGLATYPSTQAEEVQIYAYRPTFKFRVIGVIEARGMAEGGPFAPLDITTYVGGGPGEKEDMALAMKALKVEAGNAGATGVVIIHSQQVRVSDTATERRLRAAAIVRLSD